MHVFCLSSGAQHEILMEVSVIGVQVQFTLDVWQRATGLLCVPMRRTRVNPERLELSKTMVMIVQF